MDTKRVLTAVIYDPGADARINLLRVPTGHQYTIEAAYAVASLAINASTANYVDVSLENGDTAGTAQTAIGGTAGGTAGWAANTPKEITITSGSGKLTAGQWLNVNYAETGTVAPQLVVVVEYVDGIGSKA
jgi:hypothetical protein